MTGINDAPEATGNAATRAGRAGAPEEVQAAPPLVDPVAEGMDPNLRRGLQQRRLRLLVDRLLAAGGLQSERLRATGVHRGADVTLDNIDELPMVTKQDLWDHYPFGLQLARNEDIVCIHGSSGTGGRPTLVPYTAHDVDVWAQVMARALGGAGANRASRIHCAYGYGLFTGGMGVHHGAIRLGATVIPLSGGMTDRQVRLMRDLRPDILACTPSYAVHLGEALRAAGVTVDEFSLRAGVFGAEPWTEGLRRQVEDLLGLRALDIYGLSEVIGPGVACESLDSQGMLNVAEDHFLIEVVDADGKPLPDGTPGELVFTTLTKTGMPLLRYRTGDIARLANPVSDSPRTLRRMSKVLGRVDDMLTVRGVNVFPSEIEAVLLADERVAPHYVVVEDRRNPARTELRVAVEPFAESYATAEEESLRRDITTALRERLGVGCVVTVLPPGQVPRTETGKARRLLRWDGGESPVPGLA
ncbi:phenylacetate-coenzyme A ligase [Longimycelium tulufanense]|uniref:Phenylacetate-coenzyme A ligase n=1 Tax=Longimycelium tulufanense TaxID=907463 RepID=A0A8J3FT21_9PSEU|nr:phenylacetate--CoA ligase [Longimycelium tulufanense]GGM41761.1 phenylacetate-coenzyme A ligase [Longimycelium tulufanense]